MYDESIKDDEANKHIFYCGDLPDLGHNYSDSSSDYNSDGNIIDDKHSMRGIPGLVCHYLDRSSESDQEANVDSNNHQMRATSTNSWRATGVKDAQQADENSKNKTPLVQYPLSIHEKGFYKKSK